MNFGRDMNDHVPRSQLQTVVGATSQIFCAPDGAEARRRLGVVVVTLERSAPKGAVRLEAVPDDLPALMASAPDQLSKLCSTNPLERLNREIDRRSAAGTERVAGRPPSLGRVAHPTLRDR